MPIFRKLLYPFSVLYHGITALRNTLFDLNMLPSYDFQTRIIAVGNLNTGGTGKSPMIEYLLRLLKDESELATLSRGYKRKSKGFKMVSPQEDAVLTGDEPLQFKTKFPFVNVAVDANRKEGIEKLIELRPDVILLDDAYQHRKVNAGFYILLTSYGNLYTDDLLLPAGNLRESSSGSKRADIIVVTKCPDSLGKAEMKRIQQKLKPESHQELFFAGIRYSEKIFSKQGELLLEDIKGEGFTLVTGVANPKPLLDFLSRKEIHLKYIEYPDHYNFSDSDINRLKEEKNILTTEKDYMRLKDRIDACNLYYLPIEVYFLDRAKDFNDKIMDYINKK